MSDRAFKQAAQLLRQSRKTVALTGAGVSTESGIPDFRSRDGLWARFDPMEYGTLDAFRRDPAKVWQMLAELIGLADARPNAGHRAMSLLEQHGFLQGIITQNIDGLHQQAGSRRVVEFHGSLQSFSCPACGKGYVLEDIRRQAMPPRCTVCAAILKPDVVFFDEQIPPTALREAEELLAGADLLLVAGTSCQVAPAAYLPDMVLSRGGVLIEINPAPVLAGAAVVLAGGFSEMMERLVEELAIPGG
ncbi:MAG: hypothetical protein A2521_11550 [Deltaproteobacteria bacterium RIFOXYD12_FULL_57_12]|nr:MAG: hypothetical protein A2521_11550 [Deltaproteobacteria bacterium RIFOXYD12_FULL_57_12]